MATLTILEIGRRTVLETVQEVKEFIATASYKVALLIFFSSGLFLLPNSWLPHWDILTYHYDTTQEYGVQIFISFIVSSVILLFTFITYLRDWVKNRGRKLKIIKATLGRRTVLETVQEVKEFIANSGETDDFIQVNIAYSISSLKKDTSDRIEYQTVYILKYHITMFE